MLTRYRRSCTAALVLLTTGGQFASRLAAQDLLRGWTMNQRTGALVLAKLREDGLSTTLTLRNASDKPITAIATSSPPGVDTYHHYYDYLDSGSAGLGPGATYNLRIGPEEASLNTHRVLNVDAVIFADGRAEGSQSDIDFMNAMRLGRVIETERIRSKLARPDAQYLDVDSLAEGIGVLPESPEDALASLSDVSLPGLSVADFPPNGGVDSLRAFLGGVRNARQEALWKVEEIRGLPARTPSGPGVRSQATSIMALRQDYEAKSGVYRGLGQNALGRLTK